MDTNKLPVFRTFGNAASFAVGNYFTVLRLAWLPFTLLFAANLAMGSFVGLSFEERIAKPFAIFNHLGELAFLQVTMWLLQLLVIAAVAVSIHRIILFGDRRPGVWLNFRFGRTEVVYAAMAILWGVIIVSIMAVILAPAVFLVSGGDLTGFFARLQDLAKDWPRNAGTAATNIAMFAGLGFAYLIGWIIVLYVMLRLCVWPPAVVATNHLSPGEPWRLTDGNALRLLGLFIVTICAVYAVVAVVAVAAIIAFHADLAHVAVQPPEPAVKDLVDQRERVRELIATKLGTYWPVLWLGALLTYTAAIGMTVALISYSYKALKGYDAKEPIPEEA